VKSSAPILLVEDDSIDVMTIKRALSELGITNKLVHVTNGEAALEYLRADGNEQPCIILLDLNTPRMDGIEFLGIVKSEDFLRRIPVVVLTTSSNRCDIIESFKLGAAGYVVKSISYDRFVETLKIIDQYWTLSELPAAQKVFA